MLWLGLHQCSCCRCSLVKVFEHCGCSLHSTYGLFGIFHSLLVLCLFFIAKLGCLNHSSVKLSNFSSEFGTVLLQEQDLCFAFINSSGKGINVSSKFGTCDFALAHLLV